MPQGMQKGANFCTTLPLFYHTCDWLNQQNLPKLQVAVYYLSLIDQLFSKYHRNLMWGKLEAFIVFVYDCCDC